MSISQVGQADLRLAEPRQDQGSADFQAAVKTSNLDLSAQGKARTQGADAKLDGLLEQLLSTLQPAAGGPQYASRTAEDASPRQRPEQGPTQHERTPLQNPLVHGGPGPVVPNKPDTGRNDTAHLLQQVIALLNKQLDSGQLDPKQADQVAKLLPKLEQKFVSSADPQQRPSSSETQLLTQLNDALSGNDRQGAPGGPVSSQKQVTPGAGAPDPSAGIGSDEISAMIAHANGQGPEVNFASYDRTSINQS